MIPLHEVNALVPKQDPYRHTLNVLYSKHVHAQKLRFESYLRAQSFTSTYSYVFCLVWLAYMT